MAGILNFDLNIPASFEEISSSTPNVLANGINLNFDASGEISSHNNPDITTNNIDLNRPLFDLNMDADIGEEGIETTNSNMNVSRGEMQVKKINNLSNYQRQAIYIALLKRSENGSLRRNTTKVVASIFKVSIRTVQRIWKQSKNSQNNGVTDVSHRRIHCGRKRVQINLEQIREVPLPRRISLDSLACAMHVSKTTLFRHYKSGAIRCHSNAVKPFLKKDNKKVRLKFCISMLERNNLPHDPTFINMYNIIHIDEKWFYMTKKSENYYLLLTEENPLRTCKSKNFIGKVMFLAAIARPRFNVQGNEVFSGKSDVFTFITKEPTKRTSVNRVAETVETKPTNSPNFNVLDLSFFSAIQSLQHKESPRTLDELVSAIEKAFETFSVIKSNWIFLILQLCMIETMRAHGSNKYKIPHIKKAVLEKECQLPCQMKCDPILVQDVLEQST